MTAGADDSAKPSGDDGWDDWGDSAAEGSTEPEAPSVDDASKPAADDGWGDWSDSADEGPTSRYPFGR